MTNPRDIKKNMTNLEVQVILYSRLVHYTGEIEYEFEESLSKKCKFQRVWKDPFDGELIPRCYKVGKGLKIEDRMECTIGNCPFNPNSFYGEGAEHFGK